MLAIIFYIFLIINLLIIIVNFLLRLSRFLNRKNFNWFNNFKQSFFKTMNCIGLFKNYHSKLTQTNETFFSILTTNIDFQNNIRLLFEKKINVIKHKSETQTSFWNSSNIWSRFDMIFSLTQFLPTTNHKSKWYFIKIKLVYICFYSSIFCFLTLVLVLLIWYLKPKNDQGEPIFFLKLLEQTDKYWYLFKNVIFYSVHILLTGWIILFMLSAFFWSSIIEEYINKIAQYKILNNFNASEKSRLKWLFFFCNILICSQRFKLINDNFQPPLIVVAPSKVDIKSSEQTIELQTPPESNTET